MKFPDGEIMHRKCSQCNGNADLFMKSHDYHKRMTSEEFYYYKCPECGYIFLAPVPADLGIYYPEEYYDVPATKEDLQKTAERLQRWKIDTVLGFKSSGSLLEIGPAYGLFAFLAKEAGFDVTGIEMDQRCCQFLRNVVGINVIEGADTVTALKTLPTFDAIVMWQVFEHLQDPWSVLALASDRLNPGGILILDMPNPDAFQFKLLGRRWVHLDPPRHVSLMPADLVVKRAAIYNLKPELITTANHGANSYNGFGWAFSFKNMFSNNVIGNIAHFLGRVLGKIMIPIERTGKRGSTYTIVLKKGSAL